MSMKEIGNITYAIEPFSCAALQSLPDHQWHTSLRADHRYFQRYTERKFAIRQAIDEFDVFSLLGDVPPPQLYLFITRLSALEHTVEPIYRGIPFWPQHQVGQLKYAALDSDKEMFALRLRCSDIGGMTEVDRQQFDSHNLAVSQRRESLGMK